MWWVPIVVAVIGGPLMWGLTKFDKRNTQQHAANMTVLHEIREDVKEVKGELKDHIYWHLGKDDK
jgi:cytochrome c-type biogenesis protein CcmH/NrfF